MTMLKIYVLLLCMMLALRLKEKCSGLKLLVNKIFILVQPEANEHQIYHQAMAARK